MGQKVHPLGLRLGIVHEHNALWYAERGDFRKNLALDFELRQLLSEKLARASVSKIQIKRLADSAKIEIYSARPGVVLGKKGEDVNKLTSLATKILGLKAYIDIKEIKKPDLHANLVAKGIANQLERRVMFRRAMKRAMQNTMRAGAQGLKITVSGRLGGAEIARKESYREGRVPLHTLRANIDYAVAEAHTTYGVLGVKVWIFKGEILRDKRRKLTDGQSLNKR